MPCNHFPISVLQNGIKITTEPPRGLRANMLRSYFKLTDKYLDSSNKTPSFKKLVFGCVFFHAIIQERKKFGPVGWNIKYEFNDSDLETSLEMVKMYFDESPSGVPWETVNYMLSEISYGGRVTDDKDRRLIASILKLYYNESILLDDYRFSASGIYYAPTNGKRTDYLKYIEGLPYQDDPEAFGMHDNANISFQMQDSGYMMDTVLSVQPRDSGGGGGGKTNDEVVEEVTEDLLENMPPLIDQSEDEGTGQFDMLESGLMDSMATVVSHEMNRFNKLLRVIMRVLKVGDS
jgi:dynein heavy chain